MTDDTFTRIETEITKAFYIYKRYKSLSSFVLLYHEKELTEEQLGSFVRVSDKFIKVNSNVCFINFTFIAYEDIFKASQNLLRELDHFFNDRTSCIAVSSFDTTNSPKMIINRLTQILNETKKRSYERIENEHILDLK